MATDNTQHIQYPGADIRTLNAYLTMSAGKLMVQGGSDKLVNADIECTQADWQPTVEYNAEGDSGRLSIRQDLPDNGALRFFEDRRNDWDITFRNDVALNLETQLHASTAQLDLSTLNMASLDLQSNAGSVTLNLTGKHPNLHDALIQANATRLNATVHGSFANAQLFDFEINAVKATLDFSGTWSHSQDIALEANAGWLKVRLPNTVGVRVFRQTTMTMLKSPGFRPVGAALVNAAYNVSPVTITLDIEANVGRIELELVDRIPVTL